VKAVVLAAGRGTRMMPLTRARPKVMIPVVNRPMLEHIVVGLRDAGVSEMLFVVGHLAPMVEDYFGDGSRFGVRVEYALQDTGKDAKYGTAAATALGRDFVDGEPFVLTFGDIMTPAENYAAMLEGHRAEPSTARMAVNYMPDVSSGGAVFVRDGRVIDIVEKPPSGTVDTNYINSGVFVFQPEIFSIIDALEPSPRGEYELTTAVVDMLRSGITTYAHELQGYWSNVGSPQEVMWLSQLLLQRMAVAAAGAGGNGAPAGVEGTVHGPVFFGGDVRVARGATIVGPAIIGDGCMIGACRVGRFTSLGESCRVGDGTRVVSTAALSGVSIGDNCRVGYAILGSGARVERDASLLGTAASTEVLADNGVVPAV
jgi:UDP-N-acetylglucosamine diphosphorylase / glucose-1-phosphate thymidylyltransferase / UDP-N-acetylgalactosamine diphosphorylase / glucosamine-1-phosphate N-acetyltransferase / galactosamine-1-phosphate N-acetyltransferase